jgi:hypothetical protein
LLDATAVLDPVVRQRVLAEAAGNPLALVELPVTADRNNGRGALNGWIPLTRRLERALDLLARKNCTSPGSPPKG